MARETSSPASLLAWGSAGSRESLSPPQRLAALQKPRYPPACLAALPRMLAPGAGVLINGGDETAQARSKPRCSSSAAAPGRFDTSREMQQLLRTGSRVVVQAQRHTPGSLLAQGRCARTCLA